MRDIISIIAFLTAMSFVIAYLLKQEKERKRYESMLYSEDSEDQISKRRLIYRILLLNEKSQKVRLLDKYIKELGYNRLTVDKILLYSIICGMIMSAMYFFLIIDINVIMAVILLIPGFIMGYMVPGILLKARYESMQKEMQLNILPYVEMLQIACEAGLTLTLAIERVYSYYPTKLSYEFKKANNDFMSNIKNRQDSLYDIVDKVGGNEIKLLIESIIQAIDTGTPMRQVLKNMADSIRRDMKRKVIDIGQKAKWKNFVVSLVFQFPPYIFIVAGPSFIGLLSVLG